MKHAEILTRLVNESEHDQNTLGLLVFGSVATNTHHENSDIDLIRILREHQPSSGISNTNVEGIKVGTVFFTYDLLVRSVETVPYLLHPVGNARLLVDRENRIGGLLARLGTYYAAHPEIADQWEGYYQQLKADKIQYGYDKTTIVDVWNELEARHSGGKIRRQFFNAFYMTRPWLFAVMKWLLVNSSRLPLKKQDA